MKIDQLHLYHMTGSVRTQCDPTVLNTLAGSFSVKTCIRTIWLSRSELTLPLSSSAEIDYITGKEAYQFLLEFGCGLKSFVPGENEVFSQLKSAWKAFESDQSKIQCQPFQKLMQKCFADIKSIRREFLQNIGSSSYASIARKILAPEKDDSILIVGTGKLAQSSAPLLQKYNLSIWGRDTDKLTQFQDSFYQKYNKTWFAVNNDQLLEHWERANHILICTPHLPDDELNWKNIVKSRSDSPKVLHLGAQKHEASEIWSNYENFTGLDDVFNFEKNHSHVKQNRIEIALEACFKKALRRSIPVDPSYKQQEEDTAFAIA